MCFERVSRRCTGWKTVWILLGAKPLLVLGSEAGGIHTAAWTEAGELFTFGNGDDGQLDHGWHEKGGADAPYLELAFFEAST